MIVRHALPRILALAAVLLAGCASSSSGSSATDPCTAGRNALAASEAAYEAAFAAARACDPAAGATQCPGSTVTDRCGCALPSNADATKRAALAKALADWQAANQAEQGACDGGGGIPCPAGCVGGAGPNATVACVSAGDAGGGVCEYR
jgi:hypothetical protein